MTRKPLFLTLALAGAVAGASLLPAQAGPGQLLLPDLLPLQDTLSRAYVASGGGGRKLLRFDTYLANSGNGYLEVRGSRSGTRRPMVATQWIRNRSGGTTKRQIGTMVWHAIHGHWHLLQVAEYRLLDAGGEPVGRTNKVSFCLMDSRLVFPNHPNAAAVPRYTYCPPGQNILSLRTGISVGWADIYRATLPDQYIDVTGLEPGTYILEVEVNPDGIISEKSRANNIARAQVVL
jgi:hypothetical protein